MSSINDVRISKFLKKEDVGEGVLVVIKAVGKVNVAKEGADEEIKFAVTFNELEKPMVLNATNAQIIAKITGHEDDIEDTWPGTQIVLYDDPNVSYAGKLTGGIRVRAPRLPKAAPKKEPERAIPDKDQDLPF